MNLKLTNQESSNKYSYDILIEYLSESKVKGTVLGWENCHVIGNSKEDILQQLKILLTNRLQETEVVSLEIEIPKQNKNHPWLKFAGMFKDDPFFDEVTEEINNYRRELDKIKLT